MSAIVVPTVTPDNTVFSYDFQLKRVLPFAERIHLDIMDGVFASPKSIMLGELYWPENVAVDVHIMYKDPTKFMGTLLSLAPQLVIVHAEADGDFESFAMRLHHHGVKVGIALLPETPASAIASGLGMIDHVLIFSGHLGHYGGVADLRLLIKAKQLKAMKPSLELAWDGGINQSNIQQLSAGGIDVLNVGGYIQHATDPAAAYATLEALVR